jgi:hypothetical protein
MVAVLRQWQEMGGRTENQAYRGACRRQYRVLGNFLALAAWVRGLDCIVLVRADLERFLGFRRFKSARVEWPRADLKPWFPHQEPYYKSGVPSSIHSLFLSRVPISKYLPPGTMTTDERIARMREGAPPTARLSGKGLAPTEPEIVSRLAVLAAGLAAPAADLRNEW